MTDKTVLLEVIDGVATVTLNRPESYNALTRAMPDDINAVLDQCKDKSIHAVVFTGAGKGFCSGADLAEISADLDNFDIGEMLRAGLNVLTTNLRTLEKPVICAINGVAAGAGASIALATDYRFGSEKASFVFAAFVNIGLIPDAGLTTLLPQLVGVGKALELALVADAKNRLRAEAALSLGIVNRVVAHDDLMTEAQAFAAQLAQMPTRAINMTKQAMYGAYRRSLAEALEYEAELQSSAFQTRDFREGVAAFIEKRAPKFVGE